MNRILPVALLLLMLSAAVAAASESAADGIRWFSYEDGLKRAAETGRPIVIDFHADWCKWCKELDKKTFTDPRVIQAMNERFVPVSVDTEADKATAAKYQVQSLPTMWFLTHEGERIDALPGFVDADNFTIILDYIASGSYKTTDFQTFYESRS
ncbi:MAG TPA: thioredoxin family protein [Candidatus Krumholzibacteria bacterium]|nr:thioredoxin family protein [Candidatus Krumholzibacteria bacterium]